MLRVILGTMVMGALWAIGVMLFAFGWWFAPWPQAAFECLFGFVFCYTGTRVFIEAMNGD